MLVADHQLPIRRACQIVRLSRAAYYRPPVSSARRDAPVIAALMAVVEKHGRWGFWKCYDRLRLEGYPWNHKRVHRVYCALRLNLPRRTKRRIPHRVRRPLVAPPVLNQTWALDFMADALYDRRRFRALTVLDEGNREGLAIDVGRSIPARRLIRVLEELIALHGRPAALRMDNGPELTAQVFVEWCDERRIALYYIQPGKPNQNAFIERFNRYLSHRGTRCVSLRIARRGPCPDRALARLVQPGAATRQPRPGAAPHVSAEAHSAGTVPF